MTPMDYIRIDVDILQKPGLSDKAKMVLGLVRSCNARGLMLTNQEIGKLLCSTPNNISKILSELKDFVRIENPQSRYRKIFYSIQTDKVESCLLNPNGLSREDSTQSRIHSTQSKIHSTQSKRIDITKGTKGNTTLKRRATKPKKTPGSKFVKPTPDEVTEYARSLGYDLDGPFWIDHYESNGWKVGRNSMKDWKATIRQWKRRDDERKPKQEPIDTGGCVQTYEPTHEEAQRILRESGFYDKPEKVGVA